MPCHVISGYGIRYVHTYTLTPTPSPALRWAVSRLEEAFGPRADRRTVRALDFKCQGGWALMSPGLRGVGYVDITRSSLALEYIQAHGPWR